METTIIGVHVKATLETAKYFHFSLLNDAFATAMKWRSMNYEYKKCSINLGRYVFEIFSQCFLAVLGKSTNISVNTNCLFIRHNTTTLKFSFTSTVYNEFIDFNGILIPFLLFFIGWPHIKQNKG
jgi:hypothetical protein